MPQNEEKHLDIASLIGEATAYDKKQALEEKRPKSWCKSVCAFANGEGGALIFGIADDVLILALTKKDLVHTQNSVDRRSDLMRHI